MFLPYFKKYACVFLGRICRVFVCSLECLTWKQTRLCSRLWGNPWTYSSLTSCGCICWTCVHSHFPGKCKHCLRTAVFLNHETGCTDPAGTLSIEEFRLEFLKIRTFSPSFRLGFSSGLRNMCSAVWFEVNQIAAKLFVLCTSYVT